MLKKLRCYGIAGTAHNLFSSYLSNRSQYCQFDGNLCQPSSVLGGIPQGPILVNKSLNVIKRLREFLDLETLLIAYKTSVQPYFEYCSQVWGGLGSTLSDKLQRLQNRAIRIITKCGYDVRSHILLQNLNLKNLEIRRNQQLVT